MKAELRRVGDSIADHDGAIATLKSGRFDAIVAGRILIGTDARTPSEAIVLAPGQIRIWNEQGESNVSAVEWSIEDSRGSLELTPAGVAGAEMPVETEDVEE